MWDAVFTRNGHPRRCKAAGTVWVNMCERFIYDVKTSLPRKLVWGLFSDIDNWPKLADLYQVARWSGFPWTPDSCIMGQIIYPSALPFRYVIEECEPGLRVSYLAHSAEAGFATHRTIQFQQQRDHTLIKTIAYGVGEPRIEIPGGTLGFIKLLTERWFPAFAAYCDQHVYSTDKCSGVDAIRQQLHA